jgi:conjugal transfer pilus assembly protein TraW
VIAPVCPRARALVLFQGTVYGSLILGAALLGTIAKAGTSTIGRTWPIAEPDAMSEIEARAAVQPANIASRFGPRERWSAMRSAPLARATVDRTRSIIPFYTVEQEIRLPDGKLLYPEGFTFNPLTYVSLPQRLIIVQPGDLAWALKTATITDFILLAAGGPKDADALTLGERYGRAIFILEPRIKERLGLTVAPVIVRQVGQKLELSEVRIDAPSVRKAP